MYRLSFIVLGNSVALGSLCFPIEHLTAARLACCCILGIRPVHTGLVLHTFRAYSAGYRFGSRSSRSSRGCGYCAKPGFVQATPCALPVRLFVDNLFITCPLVHIPHTLHIVDISRTAPAQTLCTDCGYAFMYKRELFPGVSPPDP
jgi:hypothetical protein